MEVSLAYFETYPVIGRLIKQRDTNTYRRVGTQLKAIVGASHGILTHVGNTGDQVTLTQIGIQVTAR
jgi:hypothetical protein